MENAKSDWKQEYLKGKKYNFEENFSTARKCLESALSDCPKADCRFYPMIIFELGYSLFGQGLKGSAIDCMLTALKMGIKKSYAKNMVYYLVNEYGMPANSSTKKDDEEAFKSIHVMRYLEFKRKKRFGSVAEKDMILDLISDAWKDFSQNYDLSGLSAREKLFKFRCYYIVFPANQIIYEEQRNEQGVIFANFGENLCSCGSGLPYMWCCGRIKTIEELEKGTF